MCSGTSLKFCTCNSGPVDKTKPYWVLYSSSRRDEFRSMLIGTIIHPWVSSSFSYGDFSESLIEKLKSSSLFDFDYQPKEGDIISIHIPNLNYLRNGGKIKTNLRYESGKWLDLLSFFEGPETFYRKKIKSGPLQCPED